MLSPYYLNFFYYSEMMLSMLYIICNNRKIYHIMNNINIYINQYIIITGYDIYNTIANLLYGK